MITFDTVSKRYPNGREALAGVSFQIQPGEFVFLTGRSGAGKSSVLKLIALLERPSRGTVTVNGQNTGNLKAGRVPAFRRAIGVVFQDHKLLVDRPIYDNVALPLVVAGTPMKEVDRRVRAALDQVGLLGRERSSPLELSVGEQQRVGIARAVEVMKVFKRFQEVGVTVIIASHDPHLVEQFGERELVLDAGRIATDRYHEGHRARMTAQAPKLADLPNIVM
jgi:cell division transport system ATP-binding protein